VMPAVTAETASQRGGLFIGRHILGQWTV